MFPRDIAEMLFSMRADARCCALSIAMVLDAQGAIAECEVTPSLVTPTRLTYNALDDQLSQGNGDINIELAALQKVRLQSNSRIA